MKLPSATRICGAAVAALLLTVLGTTAAGAAGDTSAREAKPRVGHITVSNLTPTRESEIDVHSAGWRAGEAVAIALSGIELRRARADEHGRVDTRISIPANAIPGLDVLTVTGVSAAGVPQQIVTGVSVVIDRPAPGSPRPWIAICVLMAAATVLLLACQRVERAHAASTRLAS